MFYLLFVEHSNMYKMDGRRYCLTFFFSFLGVVETEASGMSAINWPVLPVPDYR